MPFPKLLLLLVVVVLSSLLLLKLINKIVINQVISYWPIYKTSDPLHIHMRERERQRERETDRHTDRQAGR